MKRYNLYNISEDAVIKQDSFGDYVRYEDIKELLKTAKEVAEWNWNVIVKDQDPSDVQLALKHMSDFETAYYELMRK